MQRITVAPIVRGYRFGFSLSFTKPDGTAIPGFNLTTASRIRGEFRKSPAETGAPYATVDTADGSLSVVDADTLSFSIPAASTANFAEKIAWVDFARLDAGVWSPIPVRIAWPVEDPVTIPPAA